MAIKAVQQIMLGTVTGSEAKAKETLQAMVNAGYNGIELNSFMVNLPHLWCGCSRWLRACLQEKVVISTGQNW